MANRLALALVVATVCTTVACATRPVPELDRRVDGFEAELGRARAIADPSARARAYTSLRAEIEAFVKRLDDEQVLVPKARVRGSSDYGGGRGSMSLQRRDVEQVRVRAQSLQRRVERFLAQAERPGA